MQVSHQVKQRVTAKIDAGIGLLNKHYRINMKKPTVVYKKRGATAGTANPATWVIDLNATLLMENIDDFIARTVPHELAHLGTYTVYPETMTRNVFGRRGKRDFHGFRWQEVMQVLGVKDKSRCHTYDVSNAKIKRTSSAKYSYRCTGCQTIVEMTPRAHKKILLGYRYWHRGCSNHPLVLVTSAAPVAQKVIPKVNVKMPKAGTKMAQAYALYTQWMHRYDRQGMIAVFVNELGMTTAGASTYEYNCRALYNQR